VSETPQNLQVRPSVSAHSLAIFNCSLELPSLDSAFSATSQSSAGPYVRGRFGTLGKLATLDDEENCSHAAFELLIATSPSASKRESPEPETGYEGARCLGPHGTRRLAKKLEMHSESGKWSCKHTHDHGDGRKALLAIFKEVAT